MVIASERVTIKRNPSPLLKYDADPRWLAPAAAAAAWPAHNPRAIHKRARGLELQQRQQQQQFGKRWRWMAIYLACHRVWRREKHQPANESVSQSVSPSVSQSERPSIHDPSVMVTDSQPCHDAVCSSLDSTNWIEIGNVHRNQQIIKLHIVSEEFDITFVVIR